MSKYQRENQVTDQELNEFKLHEIRKIIDKTKEAQVKKSFLFPKLALSLMMIMVIMLVVFLYPKEPTEIIYPNNIQVTQLSDNSYQVTSILNGETFHLYYQSHIVYRGQEEQLNDMFNYKMSYIYVPDEVSRNIDVEFKVFQVDDYRYFVYSKVLGQELFYEFDYFPGGSRSMGFNANMDFNDFEEDMKAIYQLINQYPPVFVEMDQYGMAKYDVNQEVYEVNDERLVSNYEYYVKNHYMHEYINGQEHRDENMTVFVNNVIILDQSNEFVTSIANTSSYDRIATLDENENHIDNSFTYIVNDAESQPSLMSNKFKDALFGRFSYFYIGDDVYGYTFIDLEKIDLDLNEITYIKYLYDYGPYHPDGDLSVDVDAFIFENNLITKPYLFSSTNQPNFYGMTLEFYNESDQLIYVYEMNQD